MTGQLTVADITHRDMLRSTSAMIQAGWPGQYDGLAERLEALAQLIIRTNVREICELPRQSITEEDECEQRRAATQEGS